MLLCPYNRTFCSSTAGWLWELQGCRKAVPVPTEAGKHWNSQGGQGSKPPHMLTLLRRFRKRGCKPLNCSSTISLALPPQILEQLLGRVSQRETEYLGSSLRSSRIFLKNSQSQGLENTPVSCDEQEGDGQHRRKGFLKWQRSVPWQMDRTSRQLF